MLSETWPRRAGLIRDGAIGALQQTTFWQHTGLVANGLPQAFNADWWLDTDRGGGILNVAGLPASGRAPLRPDRWPTDRFRGTGDSDVRRGTADSTRRGCNTCVEHAVECMPDGRLPDMWSAHIIEPLPGVPLEIEMFNLPGSPDEVAAAAYRALELLTIR